MCQRPLILWEVNRKSQCELQLLGFNTANLIHVSDAEHASAKESTLLAVSSGEQLQSIFRLKRWNLLL